LKDKELANAENENTMTLTNSS
jgi:hypothetical protein